MSPSSDKDKVGYGQPPQHSRFQKGRSGNPNGRPKKKKDDIGSTAIERLFTDSCGNISTNGQYRTITGEEVAYRGLLKKALKGDITVCGMLLRLAREATHAHIQVLNVSRGPQSGCTGIMLVPAIQSAEVWQKHAMQSQALLEARCRENP
jgi:hypothetical protein